MLWDKLGIDERYPGDIAPRPVEACDEPMLHWVATIREYNRNGGGGRLRGEPGDHATGTEDDVDAASDQFGCERRQPVIAKIRPPVFDEEISFFDETCLVQPPANRCACSLIARFRSTAEKAQHGHVRLLRTRCERPCRRAAEQRDEFAAFDHSITSSATDSSDGGTVRPSIVAVWALMTNSNLADCTTGRSAGMVPLRIRPA